jgi:hypothetical protein
MLDISIAHGGEKGQKDKAKPEDKGEIEMNHIEELNC